MTGLAAVLALGLTAAPAAGQDWDDGSVAISKDEVKTCINANLAHFLVAQSKSSIEDRSYAEAAEFWIGYGASLSDWTQSDADQVNTDAEAVTTKFYVDVESLPYQARAHASIDFLAPYADAIAPCSAKRAALN